MVGVPQSDRTNAVRLCAPDSFLGGTRGQHLPHAILAVQNGDRPGVDRDFGVRSGIAYTSPHAGGVPGQAHDAVRLVTPEISLNQGVGRKSCAQLRHAGPTVDCGREVKQAIRRNAKWGIHDCSFP
jgi:hypothetical protein